MSTETVDLPPFFSSSGKCTDAKSTCSTDPNTNSGAPQGPATADRRRFPLIERTAVECIIRMGGRASFHIISEHVSNVLTVHHKRDFPASKLYYEALQACLLNAPDVFVPEDRSMWRLTRNAQERGEKLFRLKWLSKHTGHLCKLTNKLVLGVSPSLQLCDLYNGSFSESDDKSTMQNDTAECPATQKRGGNNKKKAATQKTPRKKGNSSSTNASNNANSSKQEVPPQPQFSSAAVSVPKTLVESVPEPKAAANEVTVKKEKDANPKNTGGASPDSGLQVSPKLEVEEFSGESSTSAESGEKPKKDDDSNANRQSQCAFCGKQIQVAKRYVFYTAEDGKDDDYIGGKRNALGKRKYPDSGHVCNDCYKSNGVALRKEEKGDEPEPKRRKGNSMASSEDGSNEIDELNRNDAEVKVEDEEDRSKNDDGLMDIDVGNKSGGESNGEKNELISGTTSNKGDSPAEKEEVDSKESEEPDAHLKILQIQRIMATMMYSKANGGEGNSSKDAEKSGKTVEEIKSHILQTMDDFRWPSTEQDAQTHAAFSPRELPALIQKALEYADSHFKFVKNGDLWGLDTKNSDLSSL